MRASLTGSRRSASVKAGSPRYRRFRPGRLPSAARRAAAAWSVGTTATRSTAPFGTRAPTVRPLSASRTTERRPPMPPPCVLGGDEGDDRRHGARRRPPGPPAPPARRPPAAPAGPHPVWRRAPIRARPIRRRGRRAGGGAAGGRAPGGRRRGRRRRWSAVRRHQPAWAAAARASTMSARRLSAPAPTQAAQAASSSSSSSVAGTVAASHATSSALPLGPAAANPSGSASKAMRRRTTSARAAGSTGLRTSTASPKRSSSWGRRSPSSGFMDPTSRNLAGWVWDTPSRSTRLTPDGGGVEQGVDEVVGQQVHLVDVEHAAVGRGQQAGLEPDLAAGQRRPQVERADHPLLGGAERQLDERPAAGQQGGQPPRPASTWPTPCRPAAARRRWCGRWRPGPGPAWRRRRRRRR